jgi:cyclophilin family peptidyl-prolyl cis-trans isomerase
MKIQKIKKYFTIILLGITLFALGCSSQPSTSQPPASKAPVTQPASSAAKTTAVTPAKTTAISSTSSVPSTKPSSSPSSTPLTTPQPTPMVTYKTYAAAPAMQIDAKKKYTASVETSLGSFKIDLFAAEAPLTVNNFVFLSKDGFYNGVIFHRIIKPFMIQTGDPMGTGMGGPGYKFKDELPTKRSYAPGIVAMANSGRNTNGSQFFICTGDNAKSLDQNPDYTQFGQVSEGMDIVQKIASVPVGPAAGGEVSRPKDPPVIKSITITEQ